MNCEFLTQRRDAGGRSLTGEQHGFVIARCDGERRGASLSLPVLGRRVTHLTGREYADEADVQRGDAKQRSQQVRGGAQERPCSPGIRKIVASVVLLAQGRTVLCSVSCSHSRIAN